MTDEGKTGLNGDGTADGEAAPDLSNEDLQALSNEQIEAKIKELEAGTDTGTVTDTGKPAGEADTTKPAAATDTGKPAAEAKPAADAGKPELGADGQPKAAATATDGPSKTGDTPKGAEAEAEIELSEAAKAAILKRFPKFKGSLTELLKAHTELEAFSGRQTNELGQARQELARRAAQPPPKPPARKLPDWMPKEPITDAMVDAAQRKADEALMNGQDDAATLRRQANAMDREQARQHEEAATRAATEEAETRDAYQRASVEGRAHIQKAVPGFFRDDGSMSEVGRDTLQWGLDHGFIGSVEEIKALDADPVNGPKVIQTIAQAMKQAKQAEEADAKRQKQIDDLKAEMERRLSSVGKNISKAARSPQVIGSQSGGGAGKGTELGSDITDERMLSMPEAELDAAIAATK